MAKHNEDTDLAFITKHAKNVVVSTQQVDGKLVVEIVIRMRKDKPLHTINDTTLASAMMKAYLYVNAHLMAEGFNELFASIGESFREAFADFNAEIKNKEKANGGTDTTE